MPFKQVRKLHFYGASVHILSGLRIYPSMLLKVFRFHFSSIVWCEAILKKARTLKSAGFLNSSFRFKICMLFICMTLSYESVPPWFCLHFLLSFAWIYIRSHILDQEFLFFSGIHSCPSGLIHWCVISILSTTLLYSLSNF